MAENLDDAIAEERLRQIPEYVRRFNDVFGASAPRFGDGLRAVAAFEATIVSRNVPFDSYLEGDSDALSGEALRGVNLFVGQAGCSQCHGGALFTDQDMHNLGVPENVAFETDVRRQIALRYQRRSRGVSEEIDRAADGDLGLYYSAKLDADKSKFRTAPLREVGQTGPYMHNGVFASLREVVEFYNRGGGNDQKKSALLKPLGLSSKEVDDMVAFLERVTGDTVTIEVFPIPDYEVLP